MGTRSTVTFVKENNGVSTPLVRIYQQYDGSIIGVGNRLARFLKQKRILNGIGIGGTYKNSANGAGCLAAQYIAQEKIDIGGLYIDPIDSKNEDYNYKVVIHDDKIPGGSDKVVTITVSCFDNEPFFTGTPSELLNYKEMDDDEEF